ncbi:N-6 DNA methylase [Micromonospora parva]|uniref:N-6 DNA methylase n=1 Tax=Micromonospora parva TaxID=1464048 RepID=UPI00056CE65F|nr:N-6 DNA methylase [Micromonospora parva]
MDIVGSDQDAIAEANIERTEIESAGQPLTRAIDRTPLVLIAPSYGNRATRQRFADTLADPVNFLGDELHAALNAAEARDLLSRHPDGTARFWGALPSHNGIIDRLRPGDLIVFTGQNRVQAIGTLACKLRNPALADLLWPPDPGAPGWVNVYTVVNFRRVTGPDYPLLRKWVASSERDVFQSARALTPEKSAAVLAGLTDLGTFSGLLDVGDELGRGTTGAASEQTLTTLAEFERHLGAAVEILGSRRHLDLDTKWYLLGVLLLKYASDTSDSRRARHLTDEFASGRDRRPVAAQDGRTRSYPDELVVPEQARWDYLMDRASIDVGAYLNQALRVLEQGNQAALGNVLTHIDFTREIGGDRLSDGTLRDLLVHFAGLSLAPESMPPDLLKQGFEYIVRRFPETVSSKSGDFYAPADVTRLMIRLVDPTEKTTIYDPCAGIGGMLIEAVEHVKARSGSLPRVIAGQEINGSTWALSRLNLFMHNVPSTGLERGDTLAEPRHVRAGVLERFDRVISNPPFGSRVGAGELRHPERFRWGFPAQNRSELLFVQHAVSVLSADGLAAVVLPRGVLFRSGADRRIRAALLDDDVIEAVIGLPAGLFYLTGVATCVLVLRPPGAKPADRAGQILFADLPAEKPGRARHLVPGRVEELLAAYRAFEDVPDFAKVVDRSNVKENSDNLSVELYVRKDSSGREETGLAESWESGLRNLVRDGRYDEAAALLGEHVGPDTVADGETDSARFARLRMEFGFLRLQDGDRRVVGTIWTPIAQANGFAPTLSRVTARTQDVGSPDLLSEAGPADDESGASDTRTGRSPQQSGAVLEQATVDLFARLFHIDPDNRQLLVTRLRNQRPGTQYGHDVALDCSVAGSPTVRCHVECKNLHRAITLGDVADKLIQERFYPGGATVDHWILISPHAGPSNELRQMLDVWEQRQEYPFSVQVWSPEEGVEGLFALDPEVYQAVYGRPPGARELAMVESAIASLRKSLAPRLPIDRIWHAYLDDPHRLCFVWEEFREFDELYDNQVQLRVTDGKGALLEGSLLDETLTWVHGESTEPMLLLADFGEGKSVFTYTLARRLCEQYRWSPATGVFPLRIPLREFVQAGSGRALLQRRLEELGATLDQWRELARRGRTLVILDGFDEMTADLSPAAITDNLRSIGSCLTELTGSKVLVTSRRRTLSVRDWDRVLDRLHDPMVREIASGSRDQRVRYLEQFANDDRTARILDNLRNLYDPIGLAAKPLFLQMIKETLTELPDSNLSELILYTTYVEKSLRRKLELLEDANLSLTGSELIGNLLAILEDIAVELQRSNKSSVYLRDYSANAPNGIAAMLWKMSDDAAAPASDMVRADGDATARIGVRSLLKAVRDDNLDRWPVDFFHRSMREYFFARALVRRLRTDPQRAREILHATPLPSEIAHFAAEMLRGQGDAAPLSHLESFTRSATLGLPEAFLGGNSITLLYAARGELPNCDWSGLRLDHAQLSGANLTEARFVNTSLRNANLDNADLTRVDFTNADLDGIRLEETARVTALTAFDGERIVVAYQDGSLRQWRLHPGGNYESQIIARTEHPVERLYRTPQGRLAAIGPGLFSLYELQGHSLTIASRFATKSRFRLTLPGEHTALLLEETNGGRTRALWLSTTDAGVHDHWDAEGAVTCSDQLDGRAYAVATDEQVRVGLLDDRGKCEIRTLRIGRISCLGLSLSRNGDVLLALGQHDGQVRVESLPRTASAGPATTLWQTGLHGGTVTSVAFSDRGQLVTGGADRTVCTVPSAIEGPEQPGQVVRRLHLTLRCEGVKVDGVRTEQEQQRLRKHAAAILTAG